MASAIDCGISACFCEAPMALLSSPEENLKLLDLHDEMQLAVKYRYEHHL